MKRNSPMLFIITWSLVGLLYLPVFIASWLLHIVARLLLSISYFGLLNPRKGKDVFSSIFRWNPNL
jgi:hypothetical protein